MAWYFSLIASPLWIVYIEIRWFPSILSISYGIRHFITVSSWVIIFFYFRFEHLVWWWWYRNVSYVLKKKFSSFFCVVVLILCSTWCRLKKFGIFFYELQQRDYQTNKDMSFISWFFSSSSFEEVIKIFKFFCCY